MQSLLSPIFQAILEGDQAAAREAVQRALEQNIEAEIILKQAMMPAMEQVGRLFEDVVVDESARGKGIGEALTRAALERARQLGAKTVDLTSRPSREAANRLYQRVGFELRHTNLYRYNL